MFGWPQQTEPPEPKELWTLDEFNKWIARNGLRGRAEYHGGIGSVKVTTEELSVVFRLPALPEHLNWTFLGKP